MANDKIYLAQKDDLDNHINDRKNPHKLVAADIGAATPAYVDQQIALVTSTGIPKLNVVPLPIEATVDGQTEFFINLETFDALTDTVLVLDGRGMLLPNADFIVEGSTVIVNDPWNLGDIGGLLILKNVPMGDEGSVSGSVIAPGTIPFSALEEEIQGMIKNASGAGTGKLATYFFPFEATVDGQTVFIVPLESFDIENDTIFVVDGQGMLLPGIGYTVAGREITMAEPWSLGDGGGIYVLRNTINPDAEYVSGSIIANGSIPAEKLAEEYLPLDGSKSMFGQLIVERENYPKVHLKKKSTGAIGKYEISDNDELVLMATNQDDTDFARLYLRKNFSNISEILEVGDESNTYKVYGEHNKPTARDVGARPNTWLPTVDEISARPNVNLLHNWYFGNPVNRNGKTEYNNGLASSYTIDRWWQLFTKYDVETQTLTHSTSTQYGGAFRQSVDYPERFAGKTVTISLLAESVNGNCQLVLVKGKGINTDLATIGGVSIKNGINSFTVPVPTDVGSGYPLLIVSVGVPIGGSVKIHAIKIEQSDTQTLAHQENGNWVLNEIPDYAEQMAICQQYNATTGAYIGGSVPLDGSVAMSGNFEITKNYPIVRLVNTVDEKNNGAISMDSGILHIQDYKDSSNRNILLLYPETTELTKSLRLQHTVSGNSSYYQIYGEHNKPSGSYTGNGSATERVINTGGIGNTIIIRCSRGSSVYTSMVLLCSGFGGFVKDNASVTGLNNDVASFRDGVLTLKTDNSTLNGNGYVYYYEVI